MKKFISKSLEMKKVCLIAAALLLSLTAAAQDEKLEVPEDELARESVLPVFDTTVSVKNRNVAKEGRIDVGIFGGLALTEPIAQTTKFGIEANYHFSENHSLGAAYSLNSSGLSKDAQGLKNDFGLDFNRAPKPLNTMMLDYNYSPFYGKLSVTGDTVINTTIYGSGALGMIKYEHKSYPALALGIGERFYFGKHLSLKLDFKVFAHQAPIPFKAGALRDGSEGANFQTDPIPALDSFSERVTYTTNLYLGLNYLF